MRAHVKINQHEESASRRQYSYPKKLIQDRLSSSAKLDKIWKPAELMPE